MKRPSDQKTMTRNEFKNVPEWALQGVGEILITSYRKTKWVAVDVDEYQRLKQAAGEQFSINQ